MKLLLYVLMLGCLGGGCISYLPAQVSETDVELVLLTRLLLISAAVF